MPKTKTTLEKIDIGLTADNGLISLKNIVAEQREGPGRGAADIDDLDALDGLRPAATEIGDLDAGRARRVARDDEAVGRRGIAAEHAFDKKRAAIADIVARYRQRADRIAGGDRARVRAGRVDRSGPE